MAERSDISTQDTKYTIYTPKTCKKPILEQITKSENTFIENTKNYPLSLQNNSTTAIHDTQKEI
jgi:hypothetical protein